MPNQIIGAIVASYIGYAFLNRMPIQKEKRDDAVRKATRINDMHKSVDEELIRMVISLEDFIKDYHSQLTIKTSRALRGLVKDVENEIVHTEEFFTKIKSRYHGTPLGTSNKEELVSPIKIKRHLNVLKEDALPKARDFIIVISMLTCAVVIEFGIIKNMIFVHMLDAIPLMLLFFAFLTQTFFYRGRKEERYIAKEVKSVEEKMENKLAATSYLMGKVQMFINSIAIPKTNPAKNQSEHMFERLKRLKVKITNF